MCVRFADVTLLRSVVDTAAQNAVRERILDAYAEYEKAAERADGLTAVVQRRSASALHRWIFLSERTSLGGFWTGADDKRAAGMRCLTPIAEHAQMDARKTGS